MRLTSARNEVLSAERGDGTAVIAALRSQEAGRSEVQGLPWLSRELKSRLVCISPPLKNNQ